MVEQDNQELQQMKTRLPGGMRALRHALRDHTVQVSCDVRW